MWPQGVDIPLFTLGQIPGGEVVSQSSPSEPYPEGGPQPQLHLAIRDLDDAQLKEALEDLQLEIARREGMAPPHGSPLGWWWVTVDGGKASLDDGEVALQGGGNGDLASQCSSMWAPLEQRRMLVTSSAC